MILTYEQMFNRLSEKTVDNTRQLRRGIAQRRNGMEDLYGVEFTHNGDATHPATFYVSVSPDLVYYERFAFKFIIEPFQSSVVGISGDSLSIGETSLSTDGGYVADGTSTLYGGDLSPNPHTHSVSGSIGGLDYGINPIPTDSVNWHVRIHGVDITQYLIEQHSGSWITGQGIYPTNKVVGQEDFYDILDVACMLYADNRGSDAEKILLPEFKKVEILSDKPFGVTAFLYLKYSHANR